VAKAGCKGRRNLNNYASSPLPIGNHGVQSGLMLGATLLGQTPAMSEPAGLSARGAGLVVRRPDWLRLGGAPLAKIDREDRHRADSEEFRLPVLERSLP
jgi:hypothetical protein